MLHKEMIVGGRILETSSGITTPQGGVRVGRDPNFQKHPAHPQQLLVPMSKTTGAFQAQLPIISRNTWGKRWWLNMSFPFPRAIHHPTSKCGLWICFAALGPLPLVAKTGKAERVFSQNGRKNRRVGSARCRQADPQTPRCTAGPLGLLQLLSEELLQALPQAKIPGWVPCTW